MYARVIGLAGVTMSAAGGMRLSQSHGWAAVPIEETIGAMADLVSAGKVRPIGVPECRAPQLERAAAWPGGRQSFAAHRTTREPA